MHARTRRALALATAVGITAGLCTALTTPALAADTPAADEVVVPDPGRYQPREDSLSQAGPTGYVHRQTGTNGLLWTDAATGATTMQPLEAQSGHSGLYTYLDSGTRTVVDIATKAETPIAVPAGQSWIGAFNADTLVTRTDQDGVTVALTLVRSADGTTTETPVTGVPTGLGAAARVAQDTRGAIIRFTGSPGVYLLDYKAAALTRLPAAFERAGNLRLSADHVLGWSTGGSALLTVPRADASATPVSTSVSKPYSTSESPEFAVVGEHVVYVHSPAYYDTEGVLRQKLQTVPLGGGTVKDLLPAATKGFVTAPDGSVLAVGGSRATDWAVHRIAPGEDGAPVVSAVQKVPQFPATYSGLALGGGRLSYLSDSTWAMRSGIPALFDVDTASTGTPVATAPKMRFRLWNDPSGLRSNGDGNTVFGHGKTVTAPTDDSYRYSDLPAESTVVDAAGRYVLARSGTTTYAVDLDIDNLYENEVRLTLNNSAAALWGSRVWKPAPVKGTVNSYDMKAGTTSPAVNIGSACAPSELQAVGRWLYWACAAEGKAGVYDQTLKKSVPVTPGESLLGDGFVVRHDRAAHKLLLTNTATGQTSDLADVPVWAAADGRGTAWTVDKFGANVAFIDAQKNIHVKRVPVAPQPFTLLDSSLRQISGGTSELRWRLSRAVGPWKVEIKNASGRTVRTYQGATGNGAGVAVDWDSRDELGRGVEDGAYTYVLTTQPANGVGAAVTTQGTVWSFDVGLTTLPGTFAPLSPTRLMDTRSGLGVPKAKVGAGKTVSLKVTGTGGVPASGVTAVVLNVTATNPTAGSFVSVYPSGTRQTSASNLNFTAGQTAANLVTVPVVDGKVNFFNKYGAVDLLADVAGYYTAGTSGSAYQPVTPKRLMDTRDGTGVARAKVGQNGTVTLPVTEPGATAVVLNVTATNPTATSFVSVYPYGSARPTASNLNFTAGRTVPNLVVVPVKDGKVTFYNKYGTVDLLADVAGYFKDGSGSLFTGTQPRRLMDTRYGEGVPRAKLGAGRTVDLYVGTRYSAVVLNVTATNTTSAGFVSVYPYGTARAASNLNFTAGRTVPNLVVVPVKDGKVTFYNHSGTVDLVADLAGFYTD